MTRHRTFTLTAGDQTLEGVAFAGSGHLFIEHDQDGKPGLTPFTTEAMLREVYPDAKITWHDAETERIVLDSTTLYDMFNSLKDDRPFPLRGTGGRRYEIVAGEHDTGEIGLEHADLLNVELRGIGS